MDRDAVFAIVKSSAAEVLGVDESAVELLRQAQRE